MHVGTRCYFRVEFCRVKQHPEPAVADVFTHLTAFTSTQALSFPNPFETHSGGLHLSGQAGVLGGNVLSSLL